MSTAAHQVIYQQAQALLQTLQLQTLQQDDLSDSQLLASLTQVQHLLQQDSLLSGDQNSETQNSNSLQPLQIEINKQLRLLETDAIFLKAARQPATAQQRRQQIQTRVALLLRYCEAILALYADPEAAG